MDTRPIGILDSGFGGLSVWKEIKEQLPKENIIYFADSNNFPYGGKTPEQVRYLVTKVIEFLIKNNTKIIVIACNTATTAGIDYYRGFFKSIPIVGVVPVIKTAAKETKTGKVGILATPSTIETDYYKNLINTWGQGIEVTSVGVLNLAELVEEGKVHSPEAADILKKNLSPLKEKGVDCLCLGCTHYSFLKEQIKEIMGKDCLVLDSAGAVARQVGRVLSQEDLFGNETSPFYQFYTSGERTHFKEITQKLLNIGNIEVKYARI